MRRRFLFWFVPIALAAGCASSNKAVLSDPPGASVTINDQPVGVTPLKFDFDFDKRMKYDVAVSKDGYLPTGQTIYSDSTSADAGELKYDLEKDPSWQDTTESKAANTWLKIRISAQFSQESMWKRAIESITARYGKIEQMDEDSGYMRSLPIIRTYTTAGGAQNSIQTYFLGSISSTDPLVFRVKIVAERSAGDDRWMPWHRVFHEDEQLVEELQNRMGMK